MKQRVINILRKIKPNVDFEDFDDILSSGVFTSLQFFTLIVELSNEFGVGIDVDQMLPENFSTVDSICTMISKLAENKE